MKSDLISIVVPCYNEEASIPLFIEETNKVIEKITKKYGAEFEYIFVDDGSKDNTANVMREQANKDSAVKYVVLSKNFGKESAIYAGFTAAKGGFVAVMDVDLQDPPYMLEEMYEAIKNEGYNCCAARRTTRAGEPKIRSFFARLFYRLINKISKTEIVDGARDFRMMDRNMVDAILDVCEYNRFSKGIFSWVGFNTKWLDYENVERQCGESKWSFWKLFVYSLDGIMAFSTVPLSIASFAGIFFCALSFFMIIFFCAKTLIFGEPVAGYPSLVCIIFLVSGVQLFCLGIIGQYLSKTYLETKKRPIFIVKETNIS